MPTRLERNEAILGAGEPHPASLDARKYVATELAANPLIIEAIASTALSGNRLSEILLSTINRLLNGEPVSDRYILGLAWYLVSNKIKAAGSIERKDG